MIAQGRLRTKLLRRRPPGAYIRGEQPERVSRPGKNRQQRREQMRQVRKFAPFLTFRWWLLHTAAIAAVYAAGNMLAGG
jgi:hypothetical protein